MAGLSAVALTPLLLEDHYLSVSVLVNDPPCDLGFGQQWVTNLKTLVISYH